MAVANLRNDPTGIITGNDNIVIVNHFDGIRGGLTLDVTGFTQKIINAGHVIIKDGDKYKPMPLNEKGDAYGVLPDSASYVGYLVASIPTNRPFAAIMTRGTINPKAAPFSMDTILAAIKTALPLIDYQED
ncbi:hypothetical protein [Parabacteroides goldsteinii]|uniref:hypothetical protein n=1 Tax=Parabacteroides goldsteinii TaxID=328812 RepID=UPI002432DB07|nr:hypothetical protein [Parabacteroides goldsteinii]